MDKLASVLTHVLNRRGIRDHAAGALVTHRVRGWFAERLPALAAFVHVIKVENGSLFLTCEHSVALQECQGVLTELQAFLRLECPFEAIKDIRVSRS